MPNPRHVFWTYGPEYQGLPDLPDPRIAIARHIAWFKSSTEYTDFPTPEPDNYNRAVIANVPIDCSTVKNQVFYYDQKRNHWVTVMHVPEEQCIEVDSWIKQCRPQAIWQHNKPPHVKPRKTLLWTRDNISDTNMTDNERLYTIGYYENLKSKYFSDDTSYVDSLLGSARAILKDPWPEAEDIEVEDYQSLPLVNITANFSPRG